MTGVTAEASAADGSTTTTGERETMNSPSTMLCTCSATDESVSLAIVVQRMLEISDWTAARRSTASCGLQDHDR